MSKPLIGWIILWSIVGIFSIYMSLRTRDRFVKTNRTYVSFGFLTTEWPDPQTPERSRNISLIDSTEFAQLTPIEQLLVNAYRDGYERGLDSLDEMSVTVDTLYLFGGVCSVPVKIPKGSKITGIRFDALKSTDSLVYQLYIDTTNKVAP